ncbi:30S ribosomal protein THX [Kaistella palustris]|uniref:30S ribosomal protein THX n=1 Tax=Kaistella palustris TaxID=493376 RepID=UPI0004109E9D
MGKGDQKSKRGKIISGSYGNKRPRKSGSVKNIPVNVLDEDDKKDSKGKVRKEVGYPSDHSENADVKKEPKTKAAAKPKAEDKKADAKNKAEDKASDETKEEKPKTAKAKKTEE